MSLSFDDVLLRPTYSDIGSRKSVDISTRIFNWDVQPIISANMPSVTSTKLARAMIAEKCIPVLHRFNTIDEAVSEFREVATPACAVSLGLKDIKDRSHSLWNAGARIFFLDVAHGHHEQVGKSVEYLRRIFGNQIYIVAGNVATYDGALFLANYGANAIKVGIGPGAACITREVTGFGVPQVTAIIETAKVKNVYPNVRIIADGGIRNSGDIVKALYFGASAVMVGSLLAGADEAPTPGVYYGNASAIMNGHNAPEGVSGAVERRGTVKEIIKNLTWGVRSGFSYAGANTVSELRQNVVFETVTPNALAESRARVGQLS